jgi:hypothetical protein
VAVAAVAVAVAVPVVALEEEPAQAAVVRRAAAVRAQLQVQGPPIRALQERSEAAPILPAPRARTRTQIRRPIRTIQTI